MLLARQKHTKHIMQAPHGVRRCWTITEQKLIAARQAWHCNHCKRVLPAAYECDHVNPLWAGGADCYETNAQALCGSCHAAKSQRERIQRMRELHAQKITAIEKARLENPPSDSIDTPPKKKRRPVPIPITSPEYVDMLLEDNPFLRFAYIPR